IHSVLIRQENGWIVRDYGSRAGTRLNGKAIKEDQLRDGDTLQIGLFSFQVYLPETAKKPENDNFAELQQENHYLRAMLKEWRVHLPAELAEWRREKQGKTYALKNDKPRRR